MRRRFMCNTKYTYTIISDCIGGSITIDGEYVGIVPDNGVYVHESNRGGAKQVQISYFDSTSSYVDETVRENDCRFESGYNQVPPVYDYHLTITQELVYIYVKYGLYDNTYRTTTSMNYYSPNNATCLQNSSVVMNRQQKQVVTRELIKTYQVTSNVPEVEQILKYGVTYTDKYYYSKSQYIDPKSDEYPNGINLVTSPHAVSVNVAYWESTYPRTVMIKFFSKDDESKICWLTMTYEGDPFM